MRSCLRIIISAVGKNVCFQGFKDSRMFILRLVRAIVSSPNLHTATAWKAQICCGGAQ